MANRGFQALALAVGLEALRKGSAIQNTEHHLDLCAIDGHHLCACQKNTLHVLNGDISAIKKRAAVISANPALAVAADMLMELLSNFPLKQEYFNDDE